MRGATAKKMAQASGRHYDHDTLHFRVRATGVGIRSRGVKPTLPAFLGKKPFGFAPLLGSKEHRMARAFLPIDPSDSIPRTDTNLCGLKPVILYDHLHGLLCRCRKDGCHRKDERQTR